MAEAVETLDRRRERVKSLVGFWNDGRLDDVLDQCLDPIAFSIPVTGGSALAGITSGVGKLPFKTHMASFFRRVGRLTVVDVFAAGSHTSIVAESGQGERFNLSVEMAGDGRIARLLVFSTGAAR